MFFIATASPETGAYATLDAKIALPEKHQPHRPTAGGHRSGWRRDAGPRTPAARSAQNSVPSLVTGTCADGDSQLPTALAPDGLSVAGRVTTGRAGRVHESRFPESTVRTVAQQPPDLAAQILRPRPHTPSHGGAPNRPDRRAGPRR